MIKTDLETLTLNEENRNLVLHAFKLVRDSEIPEIALKLRERFRGVLLYQCIISDLLAEAFVLLITGKTSMNNQQIEDMNTDLQTRLQGDFSASVTAMIHIIREELDIE